MKLIFACTIALVVLQTGATALSQIKQWTDENGVTHFESRDTGKTPSPRIDSPPSTSTPGKTAVRIERAHAGATLGDNDSSFRNSPQWRLIGADKFGAEMYVGRVLQNTPALTVHFVDQRLAIISITYSETTLGGWEKAIKNTSDKYGAPKTNGFSEATWLDGQTLLTMKKDFRGGIEVKIGDVELSTRYTSRSGQAAPKF